MSSDFAFLALLALLAATGYLVRWYIRPQAPLYKPPDILIAGLSIGLGLSFVLSLLANGTDLMGWRLAVLHALALAAIGFIAVSPEPIDSANKTRQVALVAALAYAGLSFAISLFVFGSYFFG